MFAELFVVGIPLGTRGISQQALWSRVRLPIMPLEFLIDLILPAALWPGVDSASYKNKYQEYFLGG